MKKVNNQNNWNKHNKGIPTSIFDEYWFPKFDKIVKTYERDVPGFHLDACLYGEIIDFISSVTKESYQIGYARGKEEGKEICWIACKNTIKRIYQKFSTDHHTHNAFAIELENIEPGKTKELWKAIKTRFLKEFNQSLEGK